MTSVMDHRVTLPRLPRPTHIQRLSVSSTWQWIAAYSSLFIIPGFFIANRLIELGWMPEGKAFEFIAFIYIGLSLFFGYWWTYSSSRFEKDRLENAITAAMFEQAYKDRGVAPRTIREKRPCR